MRQKKSIIADMSAVFTPLLAEEIAEYCIKKRVDPFIEFINPNYLPAPTLAAWTTPEARDFIAERCREDDGNPLLNPGTPEFDAAATALVSQHFITTDEAGYTLYRITDRQRMIVAPCPSLNQDVQVGRAIYPALAGMGLSATGTRIKQITDAFKYTARVEPSPPVLWAQPDQEAWCFARARIKPDASVPFPQIRTFLDRLNDPEALSAFIAGVYFDLNPEGRQCLWVSDTTGKSGKSRFFRAISRLFDELIVAALNGKLLEQSPHISAHFVNKKLAIIGDCNNPRILMSGALKEISGDDKVLINGKYKDPVSTYLQCRIIILSNPEPHISGSVHNQSRTLWIKLAPLPADTITDPEWELKLDAEMPGFLAYALQCYKERCPDNYEIRTNAAVQAAVAQKIAEFEERFDTLLETYFAIDPNGAISSKQFNDTLRNDARLGEHEINNFRAWLVERHGVTPASRSYRGIRKRTDRDIWGGSDATFNPIKGDGFTMLQRNRAA